MVKKIGVSLLQELNLSALSEWSKWTKMHLSLLGCRCQLAAVLTYAQVIYLHFGPSVPSILIL